MPRRHYLTWAASILAPRDRLLPGVGARLQRSPRLTAVVLGALRRAPTRRARAALFNHVSQPLVRRMDRRLEVSVTGGSRMVVDAADLVGSTLAIAGVWESHVTAAFRALLRSGDVCVDAGANIGYFTLLASRLVGPSGRVYAFEPATSAYAALRANLDLNGLTNVTALQVAVGAAEGEGFLSAGGPRNPASASLRGGKAPGTTRVVVRRIDSVLPKEDLSHVRLVKIDVEGYEPQVLEGLTGIFAGGARPAVIVEVNRAWIGDRGLHLIEAFCDGYSLDAHEFVGRGLLDGDRGRAKLRLAPVSPSSERHELLLLPREGAET